MESKVAVVCAGAGGYTHKPRTIAQFRRDDGWARIHIEGPRDALLWKPEGNITLGHRLSCDVCTRNDYATGDRLYPVLDAFLAEGRTEVDAADIARALRALI